ncbi:MAG: porin [Alphaproteobacteria bacterium]|nr:porin [Alphaproteobacteria bacterium]
MLIRPVVIAAIALAAQHAAAWAQDQSYPQISGEVVFEVENDWTYDSDDRANQNNDLFLTIEPALTLQLSSSWSIYAHAVLEPVRDPEQFENRYFEDNGLYVEDLFVEYADGAFGAKAGKLNVGFGVAWDIAPGVFGTDFGEDGYEISERIGVIGNYTFASEQAGEHRVSVGSFFLDTTILSQSTLRGRGDTRKRDGGVSNTEDFSSFVVAVDGGKIPKLGNLAYHAAYLHQASGVGDTADESAVALALYTSAAVAGGITVSPLVEYVHQEDAAGVADRDIDFLTLAAQAEWNGFNLAVAWTGRRTDAAADQDDYQFQVSAGYAFDFGLTFDVGWRIADEADVETRTLGAIVAYTYEF